ncbi:hypothetical protein CHUAL_010189 [Chamberlinius hualienensis]
MASKLTNVIIPSSEEVENVKNCHLIPCQINHTGKAEVSKYFEPVVSKTQDGITASFRGRSLIGDEINLSKNYCGVVIEKSSNEGNFKAINRFDKFTYWNWDKQTSDNDKIKQALSWLAISQAINFNSEVSETDVEDKI